MLTRPYTSVKLSNLAPEVHSNFHSFAHHPCYMPDALYTALQGLLTGAIWRTVTVLMSEVFGLDYSEPLGIRPLGDFPGLEVTRLQRLMTLRDCIAWMATCGEVDYRQESIPYLRQAFVDAGFAPDVLEQYSPMTDEWTPECAITEKRYLAESRFLALPVLSTSDGQASTAEVPFGVIGGLLRGQQVFTHIAPGGELDQRVFIGRTLARSYLKAFQKELAPVHIQNFRTLQQLQRGMASATIRYLQRPAGETTEPGPITLQKPLLQGRIAITGSGNQPLLDGVLRRLPTRMARNGMAATTYTPGFDSRADIEIAKEVANKTSSAVNLVTISREQLSFGAVGEIGWLVLGSILHDQSLGIYMERYDRNKDRDNNSDKATETAANRQRHLTMSHIGRLLQDFPWLTQRIKITDDLQYLSEWGKLKLDEHYDWRKAMGFM